MPKKFIRGLSKLVSLNVHVWCAARHARSCSNCVGIWLQHPPDKNGYRKNETRGTECARPRRFFCFFSVQTSVSCNKLWCGPDYLVFETVPHVFAVWLKKAMDRTRSSKHEHGRLKMCLAVFRSCGPGILFFCAYHCSI